MRGTCTRGRRYDEGDMKTIEEGDMKEICGGQVEIVGCDEAFVR